jgi:putative phosphoribosyl transferase
MFRDRADAGAQLAKLLQEYKGRDDVVLLGIPRGGVEVAAEVAKELGLPLDVVVVRKIGAPGQPEYAVAAVDEDGGLLIGDHPYVSRAYLDEAATAERAEISRRLEAYRAGRKPLDVAGKTVLLVDDGIATGLTVLKSIGLLRDRGAASVVVAAPVVAPSSAAKLRRYADRVVAVSEPAGFAAVGQFYDRFPQTTDDEVRFALSRASQS